MNTLLEQGRSYELLHKAVDGQSFLPWKCTCMAVTHISKIVISYRLSDEKFREPGERCVGGHWWQHAFVKDHCSTGDLETYIIKEIPTP